MKVFLGIDLSRDVKEKIEYCQNMLVENAEKGKWKYPDSYHITIKYIGDIDEAKVDDIDREMEKLVHNSFSLEVGRLDSFRKNEALRVLYLEVKGDIDELNKLYREVEDSMKTLGFKEEKRDYTPHITVGHKVEFKSEFEEMEKQARAIDFPVIEVDRVTLFESKSEEGRRVYLPIREYILDREATSC